METMELFLVNEVKTGKKPLDSVSLKWKKNPDNFRSIPQTGIWVKPYPVFIKNEFEIFKNVEFQYIWYF